MSAATQTAEDERSEQLRMIRASAAAVAPPGGDLKRIRALRYGKPSYEAPGFDRAVWRSMCEFGWPGLRVDEAAGGSGLGMGEFCALVEELGAGLVPEPLIQVAMAARLLNGAALASLLAGTSVVIPAWQERANSFSPVDETSGTGGRVTGKKVFVPMAAGADAFLVTTTAGLVLVPRDADGVTMTVETTQDGGHFGTVTFSGAAGTQVPGEAGSALDEAALATAAYLLGVMERAFAMTLEYLKTRKQFGKLIGSFQALQHRAADLKIQLALTRATVESAAMVLDTSTDPTVRAAAVSRAKARAATASMLVTRQCIQLHGGIAYTDEYDVGLFLRKAMVLSNLYGSATLHRARFAASSPDHEDGDLS